MLGNSPHRLVTLREIADHCPARRRGKRPHLATVYRWAFFGVDHVFLELVRGIRPTQTTEAAMFLFFENLAAVQRRRAGAKSTGKNDWVITKDDLRDWNQWVRTTAATPAPLHRHAFDYPRYDA
ncbi:hypothetical protein [Lacipirellula limnantheis]|uniref:Uncharacterized protein n=1 Tax=Lacipirellula limnantheis TaxID=2528024 RepID=A0A517U1I0_9BACT|nr:hypothetical protein [Lacipirellula limnantheis]QDT74467.1 hypothetical protein I41_36640 [Lacipirellula limnantheis]